VPQRREDVASPTIAVGCRWEEIRVEPTPPLSRGGERKLCDAPDLRLRRWESRVAEAGPPCRIYAFRRAEEAMGGGRKARSGSGRPPRRGACPRLRWLRHSRGRTRRPRRMRSSTLTCSWSLVGALAASAEKLKELSEEIRAQARA
jgi:hypothetical protein